MYVVNGGEPEVSAVRKCFQDRWPYPVVKDAEALSGSGDGGGGGGVWLFKVKRYPWHSSRTGNKHLDKFVEAANAVAAAAAAGREVAALNHQGHQNTDSEAGQSLLAFILKVCKFFSM